MVSAYERVTLYGLTLVPRRRVHYGPINPKEAREVFIRGALVAGEFDTRAPFLAHNRGLLKEIEALEHKARRRDVLVDEEAIYALLRRRGAGGHRQRRGFREVAGGGGAGEPAAAVHDARVPHAPRGGRTSPRRSSPSASRRPAPSSKLALSLRAGASAGRRDGDGAAASAQPARAGAVRVAGAGTDPREGRAAVQGAAQELAAPSRAAVPQHVTAFLTECEERETRDEEREALASGGGALRRSGRRASPFPPTSGRARSVPAHLLMNFRVIDEAGRELAMGRDLAALKAQLGRGGAAHFRGRRSRASRRAASAPGTSASCRRRSRSRAAAASSPAIRRWWTRATASPSACSTRRRRRTPRCAAGCGG